MNIILQGLLTVIGLLFDIIGAWYIARGLVLKTTDEFIEESTFFFGNNDNSVVSGIRQKIECRSGFQMMFIGFGLQLLSQMYQDNIYLFKIDSIRIIALILSLSAVFAFVIRVLNYIVIKEFIFETKKYINNKIMQTNKLHVLDAIRYIKYIKPDYSPIDKNNDDVKKYLFTIFDVDNEKDLEIVGQVK